MAFNPFDTFRKNSKPILAVVTIFIMFIFVLSSGVGQGFDFFDWISRQIGGDDRRGPVLASIDGTDYHQKTLYDLRMKRAAANIYLFAAADAASPRIVDALNQELKANAIRDRETATLLTSAIDLRERNLNPRQEDFERFRYSGVLRELQGKLEKLSAKENPVEYRAIQRFFRVMTNDSRRNRRDGQTYFGAISNATEQDALQFIMYRDLAESDPFKIKFTEADVKRMIDIETDGPLPEETSMAIIRNISQNRLKGVSSDQIFEAIGDEYRVLAARKLYIGSNYTVANPNGREETVENAAAALTPFEFYTFYKDRCAELTFDVVDVSVESFLPKVVGTPTDIEIKSLFDRFRSVEYTPTKETPGFKDSRRIRVEYVSIDPKKDYYKEVQPLLQAASAIAAGFTSTYVGVGPIPAVMTVVQPEIAEPLAVQSAVWAKMEQGRIRRSREINNTLFLLSDEINKTGDARLLTPIAAASLIAQMGMMSTPVMEVSAAVASYRNWSDVAKTRAKIRQDLDLQLAMSIVQPSLPIYLLGMLPAALESAPEPNKSKIEAEEIKTYSTINRPKYLAKKDLEGLEKNLKEIRQNMLKAVFPASKDGAKKDPIKIDKVKVEAADAEARAYLNEWLAAHKDFVKGTTPKPVDRFRLASHPSLTTLFADVKDQPNFEGAVTRAFFEVPDDFRMPMFMARFNGDGNETTLYNPIVIDEIVQPRDAQEDAHRDFRRMLRFLHEDRPVWVAWKIDEQEPKVHPPIRDVAALRLDNPDLYDTIVRAWKMEKARELAKAAADKFASDVHALAEKEMANNPAAFDNGFRDLVNAGGFTALNSPVKVAMLKKQDSLSPEEQRGAIRYTKTQIDNRQIAYPLPVMVDMLLDARDKPKGEVVVISDSPKSHYYVSILVNKRAPTLQEFYSFVYRYSNVAGDKRTELDTLYQEHAMMVAAQSYVKDLDNRIKAQTKFKETEELKKVSEKGPQNFD